MEFNEHDAYEGRCPKCGMIVVIRLYDTSLTEEKSLKWCTETHWFTDEIRCGEAFDVVCDDPLTYVAKLFEKALKNLSWSET